MPTLGLVKEGLYQNNFVFSGHGSHCKSTWWAKKFDKLKSKKAVAKVSKDVMSIKTVTCQEDATQI